MAGLQFWEKEFFFYIRFEGVQRGFLSERKGKDIPCRWTENRKGAGTDIRYTGTPGESRTSTSTFTQLLSSDTSCP